MGVERRARESAAAQYRPRRPSQTLNHLVDGWKSNRSTSCSVATCPPTDDRFRDIFASLKVSPAGRTEALPKGWTRGLRTWQAVAISGSRILDTVEGIHDNRGHGTARADRNNRSTAVAGIARRLHATAVHHAEDDAPGCRPLQYSRSTRSSC